MAIPVVYGPPGSTYVRSVTLTLEEKGAAYTVVELPFGANKEPAHLARHPFAKVPAFEHDGFSLYETQAIIRYVDQVFPGAKLQPSDAPQAARMNQIIGMVDAYGWPTIAAVILFNRLRAPRIGVPVDEAAVAAAIPRAHVFLAASERLMADHAFLAGDCLSLADLMMAPILAYVPLVPEGKELLAPYPRLAAWSARMAERDSMVKTQIRR
jgi:glutathione S-transferase